ncbi:PREDICTED: LOB domain-containing protein 20-like [Ipomoea nil]|uniref:LOB domain-containing protein 20-like n=1 Tax=Ipomoea nil TaxID=35883 RepID=UPI0009009A75|nr:PREDICTED: LOB domain-containing protein 20-like [Ipomoea nil]
MDSSHNYFNSSSINSGILNTDAAYPQGGGASSSATAAPRRNYTAGRAAVSESRAARGGPCGACKFLRRKCVPECIFAPYFDPDEGTARFAAIHRVFGASNVSKLLMHIPADRRPGAVISISFEAEARQADPVYGCVSTILALKQQVSSLEAELAMVKTQIVINRFAAENNLQTLQHQQQQQEQNAAIIMEQPVYLNNTFFDPNSLLNLSNFTTNYNYIGEATPPISQSLSPIFQPPNPDQEHTHYPLHFTNQMFP